MSAGYFLLLYFPIYWLFTSSLKSSEALFSIPPRWIFIPVLEHYEWILSFGQVISGLKNSIIVATATTVLSLALGLPCAYGLARFQFKHRDDLKFWIITLRMLPPVAVVIPFYLIWLKLHLYDTYIALLLSYMLITMPIVVWLMGGFFEKIPRETEDAAMIDGASIHITFLRVSLPLATPGLIITIMLIFIFVWNDLFFSFMFTTDNITLPVALAGLSRSGMQLKWGAIAAGGVISTTPGIIFALIARKFVVSGLQGLSEFVK
jgi:multiple sugar transport system permease protein